MNENLLVLLESNIRKWYSLEKDSKVEQLTEEEIYRLCKEVLSQKENK